MTEITEILYQWLSGISQRKISALTGTSRNTVNKIIEKAKALGLSVHRSSEQDLLAVSAQLKDCLSSQTAVKENSTEQQLSLHHEEIKAWLSEPYMTVRQIRRLLLELKPLKSISETSLHRYIKKHFPKPINSTVVLHTKPGEQAQVDFGYAGKIYDASTGKHRRMYAFVMTLSYSRLRYVRFVYQQDVATWIDCHISAFNFFGGVPKTILLDNLKAGVIKANIYDPIINRSYAECARFYGFIVDPSKVRTPTHKGKVERSIQIVRQQVLAGRHFNNICELNHYANEWCKDIIANEVTRTTGETPRVKFDRDERQHLHSLPLIPYEHAQWQEVKVGRDQHITFKGSFYSVPTKYVHQTVMIKATLHMIYIYHNENQIKVYSRSYKKGSWQTTPNDISDRAKHFIENTPDVCLEKAKEIGMKTYHFFSELLKSPTTSRLRKAQAILRLAEKYSAQRLESVCAYALTFGNTDVEALKRIMIFELDKKAINLNHAVSTEELSEGAFLRDPSEFSIH